MTLQEKIQRTLAEGRYPQKLSAYPLMLNAAALSATVMRQQLGFGYTNFLFHYKNGIGELSYSEKDLADIWRRAKPLVLREKFLHRLQQIYRSGIRRNTPVLLIARRTNLQNMSDAALLRVWRQSLAAIAYGVGVAHICEAVGIGIEPDLQAVIAKQTKDEKARVRILQQLAAPLKPSFLLIEEDALARIRLLPKKQCEKALANHAASYSWIAHTYLGRNTPSLAAFRRRMTMAKRMRFDAGAIAARKHQLLRRYGFGADVRRLIRAAEFFVLMQDERKIHILQAQEGIGRVTEEISRRTGIPAKLLHQHTWQEAKSTRDFRALRRRLPTLRSRNSGVIILWDRNGEQPVSGAAYRKILPTYKHGVRPQTATAISGTTAHPGIASGRVVVCYGLADINAVRPGDVVVASMTRPEYMPALKKAVAIVTDEGGVTCHAAIVARELKIPTIIGTRSATHILITGIRVEVDASRGMVRIV